MKYRKLIILIFTLIILHNIIFTQSLFEKHMANFSGQENIYLEIEIEFEIDEHQNILSDFYFLKNRFFIIKVKKPELFSDIYYIYDYYNNYLYTKVGNSLDKYEDANSLIMGLPNFFQSIFAAFEPEKFISTNIEKDDYLINLLEPKSKSFLNLLRVDYVKFKVYFFNPMNNIYIFEKIEIVNFLETKKIILKAEKIKNLDKKESETIINQLLSGIISDKE